MARSILWSRVQVLCWSHPQTDINADIHIHQHGVWKSMWFKVFEVVLLRIFWYRHTCTHTQPEGHTHTHTHMYTHPHSQTPPFLNTHIQSHTLIQQPILSPLWMLLVFLCFSWFLRGSSTHVVYDHSPPKGGEMVTETYHKPWGTWRESWYRQKRKGQGRV